MIITHCYLHTDGDEFFGEYEDIMQHLKYLSVYKNGIIRYAAPKLLVIAHDNPDKSADDCLKQKTLVLQGLRVFMVCLKTLLLWRWRESKTINFKGNKHNKL